MFNLTSLLGPSIPIRGLFQSHGLCFPLTNKFLPVSIKKLDRHHPSVLIIRHLPRMLLPLSAFTNGPPGLNEQLT